jgi:hypothetical protein
MRASFRGSTRPKHGGIQASFSRRRDGPRRTLPAFVATGGRRTGDGALIQASWSMGWLGERRQRPRCLAARGACQQRREVREMLERRIGSRVEGQSRPQGRPGSAAPSAQPGEKTARNHFYAYARGPPRIPPHVPRAKHDRDAYLRTSHREEGDDTRYQRDKSGGGGRGAPLRTAPGTGKAILRPPIRIVISLCREVRYSYPRTRLVCA